MSKGRMVMIKYTKEQIEKSLRDLLNELMRSDNQDGSIRSFHYNEDTKQCTVVFSTCIIEEDDYIGFQGY